MDKSVGMELRSLRNLIKRLIYKYSDITLENATELHGQVAEYLLQNQHKDIYQKDFEEEFMIRRSTASRMLKLMEKNGMIQRLAVGQDARLKKIVLTEKGMNTHNIIMEISFKIDAKMKQGIPDDELVVFFKVIDQFKKNLEE